MASKKSNVHAFSRMNYLYQAASMCVKTKTEQSVRLGAYYGMLLRGVGKKAQARMDPSMKRTLCKGCHVLLVPGATATVRLQKRPDAHITWLCQHCGTIKRFNLRKDYKIWVEHDEAVVVQAANVRTDETATGTSGSKTGKNAKNNIGKQSKTTGGDVIVKECDARFCDKVNPISDIKQCGFNYAVKVITSTTLVAQNDVDLSDGLNNKSVSHIKKCDIEPRKQCDAEQCGVDPTDELKYSVSDIKLSDVDPADKINPSVIYIKERNVEPTDELNDSVIDMGQCETSLADNISAINNSVIKEYNIDPAVKVSDIKVCDNFETDMVMDVDSNNVNETVVSSITDIDSSNITEGEH